MSRPRLDVQLCAVNTTTHQYGPDPPSNNLLGVDFLRAVPPDTEFPRTLGRLDVFVRFFVAHLESTTIAVRVWHLNPDGTDRERVNEYLFEVPFQPSEIFRDRVFRLVNVRLPGEGDYAVRVCRRARHKWKRDRWRVLATDYFRVVKS